MLLCVKAAQAEDHGVTLSENYVVKRNSSCFAANVKKKSVGISFKHGTITVTLKIYNQGN